MTPAVPRDFPRWGGPEPTGAPLTQFGLAEGVQSRMVLAGVLTMSADEWLNKIGVRPEESTIRGQRVRAAYFETPSDAYLLLSVLAEPDNTQVWAYAPPSGFGHNTTLEEATGRAQLLRLLDQLALGRHSVVVPSMPD